MESQNFPENKKAVIFLDIDGVLNCQSSKSRCAGFIGIDNSKVKVLRKIVEQTSAKIVLVSSWKSDWEPSRKEIQNEHGNYLDKKLRREGLRILDKTRDGGGKRGVGIIEWLNSHAGVTSWVGLDDKIFPDYEECGILEHLVKTDYYSENGGLREEHIEPAVKMLGG